MIIFAISCSKSPPKNVGSNVEHNGHNAQVRRQRTFRLALDHHVRRCGHVPHHTLRRRSALPWHRIKIDKDAWVRRRECGSRFALMLTPKQVTPKLTPKKCRDCTLVTDPPRSHPDAAIGKPRCFLSMAGPSLLRFPIRTPGATPCARNPATEVPRSKDTAAYSPVSLREAHISTGRLFP